MSLAFSMTAVGVAMAVTALSGGVAVIAAFSEHKCGEREIDPIETRFADAALLRQALQQHGFEVLEEGLDLLVVTNVGSLRFSFNQLTGSFWVQAFDLVDEEALADSLEGVSTTYLQGVQRSNYLAIKQRAEARDDVSVIGEEILEDDTIVLTLEV